MSYCVNCFRVDSGHDGAPFILVVVVASGVCRKFSWGVFHSVANGGHLRLVCAVCDVTIDVIFMFWQSLLT